jgi:PRC-barrel domain
MDDPTRGGAGYQCEDQRRRLKGQLVRTRGTSSSSGRLSRRDREEVNMEAVTETGALISAGKVNGAAVYDTSGEHIGKIYDIMLDKVSGKVAYAIMSFGGFLGMGDSYYPLPWPVLHYDTGLDGYVVNVSKAKLEGAPNYHVGSDPTWGDRAYDQKVYGYYGSEPFWGIM